MTSQSEQAPTLRLVDRLRGKYVLPVNDGAGPLNGSSTFTREFPAPPIQKEAADMIEALTAALSAIVECSWEDEFDFHHCLPSVVIGLAEAAIAKAEGRS